MLESFLLYVLSVYFLYYVLGKSELFSIPRAYAIKSFPWWVTKPLTCAFCMTFWAGIVIGTIIYGTQGVLAISTINLMAAPVAALIVDLGVQALIKIANR